MKKNLVSEKTGRIITLDQLFEASEIEKSERQVTKQKINKWEVWSKDPKTGEVTLTELFQIVAELKPKHPLLQTDIKALLMDCFKDKIPVKTTPSYIEWDLLGQIIHTDLHRDRYEHKGKNYLKEIQDRTLRLFEVLLTQRPDKILYANLWDSWNSDWNSKTTHWTPQHNYLSESESFKLGVDFQLELIRTLSSELPVEAIFIAGNHDLLKMQMLADAMDIYFSSTSNVDIDARPLARKYKKRWKTVLGYGHWDWMKDKQILPTVQSETKLGKYNYFHKGHIHQRIKDEKWQLEIDTFPSPAHPSERERLQWRTTRWWIYGHLFDKNNWKVAEFKK